MSFISLSQGQLIIQFRIHRSLFKRWFSFFAHKIQKCFPSLYLVQPTLYQLSTRRQVFGAGPFVSYKPCGDEDLPNYYCFHFPPAAYYAGVKYERTRRVNHPNNLPPNKDTPHLSLVHCSVRFIFSHKKKQEAASCFFHLRGCGEGTRRVHFPRPLHLAVENNGGYP